MIKMAIYSYTNFISQLYGLTQFPYEVSQFKIACQGYGWQVVQPEWQEPDDEPVMEVQTPFWTAPLVAIFGEEQMAGLFLYALIGEYDEEDNYRRKGFEWFNARFADARTEIEGILGDPADSGQYRATFEPNNFSYAVWAGKFSDLILVQHDEGVANFGHDATIDIRIIAHSGSSLVFPLESNLIF
jgi:hypothetical protein